MQLIPLQLTTLIMFPKLFLSTHLKYLNNIIQTTFQTTRIFTKYTTSPNIDKKTSYPTTKTEQGKI